MTAEQLEAYLTEIKAAGNEHFKTQSFGAAVASFTDAVDRYGKYKELIHATPSLLTLMTQCYTNRSLGWHKLNLQEKAYADADFVLTELDSDNMKALYRRGHAMGKSGRLEEAIADLQRVIAKSPSDVMTLELEALQRKLGESTQAESEGAAKE
jgi:tetratricopeptide (TPR) repeat protein